ncbi:MAG: sortase [Candidatus Shapirobacteria bacterium]|jgi:LPXTG-site transpeptidase (sortase) family protein
MINLVTGDYGKLEDKICQMKVFNFFRVIPKKRKVRVKSPRAIIYYNPPKYRKLIFYAANVLFLGALIYGGYLYTPLISAFYKYKFSKNETTIYSVPKNINKDDYIIQIPKILAYSKVVENVSPFDQAEYDRVLKNNVVAQAKGTAVPGSGKGKSIYIFAHSSNNNLGMLRSNAVFYLLGELQKDDLIYIVYHEQEIKYKVFDKKIVSANDLDYLNYSDPSREVLILQTCWPIGTDWNRLIVLAEKI